VIDDSEDPQSLSPWERATVAWMEAELDLRDPGLAPPGDGYRRPGGKPGPRLFAGTAVSLFGIVVAVTGGAPLDIAGWILVLVGLVIVWEQL
jgi:hypothetical protein